MKRMFTFLALVGILAVTAWLGDARPAHAMPTCAELRGQPCSSPGATLSCWTGTTVSHCSCVELISTTRWLCPGG